MSNCTRNSVTPSDTSRRAIPYISNPYRTIRQIFINNPATSTPTIQTDNLEDPRTDTQLHQITQDLNQSDSLPWGDSLQKKSQTSSRFFFQNINGLCTKNYTKWANSLEWLHKADIDIVGIAEPCINTQNLLVKQKYLDKVHLFGKRSVATFSENTNPSESLYQPGGSLILCKENWKSRIVQKLQDPRKWGRFVGHSYRLQQDHFLTVITAYRCVNRLGTSLGHKTSVKHQKDGITNEGLHSSVRQLCLDDLKILIDSTHSKFGPHHYVILMLDANESIEESPSQISKFLQETNLIDIIPLFHALEGSINTHIRSKKDRRIDFIFASPPLVPLIQKCGYLPFHQALDSDHRAIFVDINLDNLKDKTEFIASQRMIGTNEPSHIISQYKTEVHRQFIEHNIPARAEALLTMDGSHQNFSSLLNRLDSQITEIVLMVERRFTPKRNSIRWNSDIANYSLMIKYFKLKTKFINNPMLPSMLTPILDQISDQFRSDHFPQEIQNMDPKEGLKHSFRLKQKAILQSKHKREDHYFDISKRSQPHIPRMAFRQQLYMKQCHRNIKTSLGRNNYSSITTIDVPLVNPNTSSTEWQTISDPTIIEQKLIERNIVHFGQAYPTDFASGPLAEELGYTGTNQACQELLQGKLPQAYSKCSETTQMILEKLMDGNNNNMVNISFSFNDFCSALQHWDEKTTTSPSGRHLGHYRVLLPALQDKNTTVTVISEDESVEEVGQIILRVYYNVIKAVIMSGISLLRWRTSHTSMIQKIQGNSRIDKLRVIHIYEADYNLFLKVFWGRKLVYNSESQHALNEGQYGSRPGRKSSNQVIKKIMLYQYAALTRTSIATMDNDAKSCFDRIVCTLAMLISLFYGLTKQIVSIHAQTLLYMKYITKTALGPSKSSYGHSPETPIFGTGQGSCASPSLWLHISCFLMDILDSHSFGFKAVSVTKSRQVKVHNQGFVDDTSLMSNGGSSIEELISRLQSDAQTWSNLLFSSGGLLELSKCLYYIAAFQFDATGNPSAYTPHHSPLQLSTNDSSQFVNIKLLEPDMAHKTLGCFRSLNGDETTQYNHLLKLSQSWAIKLHTRYFSRQEAWMIYHNYFLPQLLYSMQTTNLSKAQCETIQSPVVNAILPLLGFNRHTSRNIVFAPSHFGGIGLTDLYTEVYSNRLESIVTHTRSETSEIGKLFLINLEYIQILTGQSIPYLTASSPITYIQTNWFSGLHEFMIQQELQINIENLWRPSIQRHNDKVIMDNHSSDPNQRLQVINNWRLFFQVNTLSDMTTADGLKLCSVYLTYPSTDVTPLHPERSTNLSWPVQGKPSQRSFCYWKHHILTLANSDRFGNLRTKLGDWNSTLSSDNRWQSYYASKKIYIFDSALQAFYVCEPQPNSRRSGIYLKTNVTVLTIPTDSMPVSCTIHDTLITVASPPKQNIHSTRPPTITSFDEYLDTLSPWEQRLLSMWSSVPKPALTKFLLHDPTLVMVSDGGCKTPKGSYGAIIGTTASDTIATIEGFAKSGYSPMTSFRCEAYGMLASFCFFKHLCIYFKVKGYNRQLDYYCDGLSLIKRISFSRFQLITDKTRQKEDFDLEVQILQEIRHIEHLGFRVTVNFVRGHQKITDESPTAARFNELADSLASRNLHAHNTWLPFDLLPTMKVILTYNKLLITGSIKNILRSHVLFPRIHTETSKQLKNSSNLVSKLWWDVIKKTLPRFSRSDRHRIIKFNYDLLHTRTKENLYDNSISPLCPHCHTSNETPGHIILCSKLTHPRQTMLNNILDSMKKSLKENSLNECIYTALGAYLDGRPIPDLKTTVQSPSEYLQEAYQQQTTIGWEQILKGRWSSLWEPIFNYEIKNSGMNKKHTTALKWASDIQFQIWSGFLDCWETRNSLLFGSTPLHQQNNRRKVIMKQISHYIQKHMADQTKISISTFENKPLPWIVNWLRHQRGKETDPDPNHLVVSN
jgi:exonuclease III